MFSLAVPFWDIILRSVAIYLVVFVGLRMLGKRELGQMSIFDLVVILLIANAVQNAMVGPDVSLIGGIISALVLLLLNRLISSIRLLGGGWGRLIEGTPSVLVQDGEFIWPHLRKEGLEREQIEMAMREHGVASLDQVKLAVLETDGSISIISKDATVVRTRRHIRQFKGH